METKQNKKETDNQDIIERSLRLILEEGQVTELRALEVGNRPHTEAGYFTNLTKMAEIAAELTTRSKGVYFIPNLVDPELLGRGNNKVKWINNGGPLTGNTHIIARRWLLIDTDYKRPAGTSATDEQTEAAYQRALKVRDFLSNLGWPDPIVATSGNGGHLMYRIDMPRDDDDLVKHTLEGLAFEFDGDGVEVDTSVHTAARIWKLYGTFACKGDEVPEQNRYHRQALINWDLTPENLTVVTKEQLEEVARIKPVEESQIEDQVYRRGGFNLEGWLENHNLQVNNHKVFSAGESWTFNHCPFSEDHADGAKLVRYNSGAVAAFCYHNSCQGMNWHDLRDLIEPGWRENRQADEETAGRYGCMFVFQDAVTGNYMVDDLYGLRSMDKQKLKDMVEGVAHRPMGRLQRYKLDYVPEIETGYIPDHLIYNSWKPSPLQTEAKALIQKGMKAEEALSKTPLFNATIKHMFPIEEHKYYFLDFLAATVQGYKLNVGIVLNDKGGTGKTLIMEFMIGEFLDGNFGKFSRRQLGDKFNQWMANRQLLFGDEIAITKNNRNDVEDFLKDFITSKKQPIRGMRENWVDVSNRSNMIIASNKTTPIYIEDTDRRWNFFNPGTVYDVKADEPWHLTHCPEWKALGVEDTIDGRERARAEAVFVGVYLYLRKPDLKLLTNAIDTDIKDHVIEAQRDRFTEFAFRTKTWDWEWVDEYGVVDGYTSQCVQYSLTRLIERLKSKRDTAVIDDLYNVFNLIYPKTNINKPTFVRKLLDTGWLLREDKKEYLKDHNGQGKQCRVLLIQSTQSS